MDMNMTEKLSYPLLVGEGSDLFLMKLRKCLFLAILNQSAVVQAGIPFPHKMFNV